MLGVDGALPEPEGFALCQLEHLLRPRSERRGVARGGARQGSFVPPEPIRQLRDLTRTRTMVARVRGQEVQRLEKLLEDAGIKLSSVASDITGVSGRAMLEALIAGERDPAVLADLAKRRMRSKVRELTEAAHRPLQRAPRLLGAPPPRLDRPAHEGTRRARPGSR